MDAELLTPRLRLRRPVAEDRDDFVRLFGDADVMRFLNGVRTPEESAAALGRMLSQWERHGYGVRTVLERDTGRFVGRCGLRWQEVADAAELLYTLRLESWGRGLATEAAREAMAHAFVHCGLDRLVGIHVVGNDASARVMVKLGMRLERATTEVVYGRPVRVYAVDRASIDRRGPGT